MTQRLTRFAVVGIAATMSYYVVALSLSLLVGVLWANVVGYAVGMGVSYFGHHRLTFSATRNIAAHRQVIARFAVSSGVAFIVSQGTLYVTIKLLELPEWLGLAFVVVTVPPLTFLLCQFWVFAPIAKERSATSS